MLARQDQTHPLDAELNCTIRDETNSLSAGYSVSKERLYPVLKRYARHAFEQGANPASAAEQASYQVEIVFRALGDDEGIHFIEQNSPEELNHRLNALSMLMDDTLPMFNKDEWREQLKEFSEFASEHRTYLEQTGLPPSRDGISSWMYSQVGRLYDTRCTSSCEPMSKYLKLGPDSDQATVQNCPANSNDAVETDAEFCEPYSFVRYPDANSFSFSDIESCDYSDASVLAGLADASVIRLEQLRHRFFDVRESLIERLIEACDTDIASSILEDCLTIIDCQFKTEEIVFLLQADAAYLGDTIYSESAGDFSQRNSPGGLTSLLQLIGYIELELSVGLLGSVKSSLPKTSLKTLENTGDDELETYITLVSDCTRDKIDTILDQVPAQVKTINEFWSKFTDRIRSWIDPDYLASIELRVSPKYVSELETPLRELAEKLESRLVQGQPISLNLTEVSASVFQWNKVNWQICFSGRKTVEPDLIGLFYISELLRHPGKTFRATELRQQHVKWKHVQSGSPPRLTDDTLRKELSCKSSDLGGASDELAVKDYEKALTALEIMIEAKRAEGKLDEAIDLEDEYKSIKDKLKRDTDYRGRPRKQSRTVKKDSDSVRKAIDSVLQKLESTHNKLWKHLNQTLEWGAECRYSPEDPIDWKFD